MFKRTLTHDEADIIKLIESFVRNKHSESDSHDYSHVLEVSQYAIDIAERIEEPVDPFILICGALLHDIGKTNLVFGNMHGLIGSAISEEFLDAIGYAKPHLKPVRDAICRIVARHTPTTMVAPETVEEKIVFDADTLDRLGIIGVLRGFIGKSGSIEEILEKKMKTRVRDYEKLNFEASREIGKVQNEQTIAFVDLVKGALETRKAAIEQLELKGAYDASALLTSGANEEFE
ncbi:MAG: HD domain-containing protein [Spirochaetales bacterium]|nr:HD domain-containing protein [Spirochaetales bacterium]